ncbi:hypothetical protein A7X67_06755 [Clostridium sp. W14A]|nr:hypothetical protein A7X67_06755 [Clostridium sp. W14A]
MTVSLRTIVSPKTISGCFALICAILGAIYDVTGAPGKKATPLARFFMIMNLADGISRDSAACYGNALF